MKIKTDKQNFRKLRVEVHIAALRMSMMADDVYNFNSAEVEMFNRVINCARKVYYDIQAGTDIAPEALKAVDTIVALAGQGLSYCFRLYSHVDKPIPAAIRQQETEQYLIEWKTAQAKLYPVAVGD